MMEIEQQEKFKTGLENILVEVDRLARPKCIECSNFRFESRLHCCLHCVYISCKKHTTHYKKHVFSVDFNHLKLYCTKCKDYSYPEEFEKIVLEEEYNVKYIISKLRDPTCQVYHPVSKPSNEELLKINQCSIATDWKGIRGLRNMGATCFMGSILQAILNNPLLKTHYLSGNHHSCAIPNCMSCQLVQLFQTVPQYLLGEYSSNVSSHSP
jgi:uncharacterized UBP type Zn finger protein